MLQSNKKVEKIETNEDFLTIFFKEDTYFNQVWGYNST